MEALVYKSTGSWYITKTKEGEIYHSRAKGLFKIEGITSTNPIAVGDRVEIQPENGAENHATIVDIYNRNNYVARISPHNKNMHHIIASNISQSLLLATLKDPVTSLGFIDRFLVACEMFHVPAILVYNKADLFRKKEMEKFAEIEKIYSAINIPVHLVSFKSNEHLSTIQDILAGHTTLLGGHSGVGKSTIINTLLPKADLRTGEVSEWSGKGMHTTTFAEMYDLPFGGSIIDTPGIRELGLSDITKPELGGYFPEMRNLMSGCKYNNCLHTEEPECAIKDAISSGLVSMKRYESYLNILATINNNTY